MYLVENINANPKQKKRLLVEDFFIDIEIEFKPLQRGWFFTSISCSNGFEVTNLRLCTSPNMMNQFINQIPFGIGIFVEGNEEPTFLEDFDSGRAKMYILSKAECDAYTEYLGE